MNIAIFRKDVGNYSETFVRRNIESLNGGRTVVIAQRIVPGASWKPQVPTLLLNLIPPPLRPVAVRLFLRRHRARAALCEFLDYAAEWAPLLQRMDIPFVSLGHGYDIGRKPKKKARPEASYQTLAHGRKILVPCGYAKTVLIKRFDFDPSVIESIPVGIDLAPFARPTLERHANKLIFVGRFVEKKSPLNLLLAFHHALSQVPDMTLDCVGEGDLLPAARHLVRSLRIQDKVVFHGSKPHDQVLALLRTSRVSVQHSVTAENGDMETMPLSIQESLACGTPAIVTDHAGLPDIVTDGKSGYITREFDYAAMGQSIVNLMRLPAADYRAMQEFGVADSARFDYRLRLDRLHTLLLGS